MNKKNNIYAFAIVLLISTTHRITLSDCTVTPIPDSPYTNGITNPVSLSYSRNNKCLAVANMGSNTVAVFSVNTKTCQLTPIGSPVSTGGVATISVAYSPTCKCLAAANNQSNDVTVFSVDPETCEITPIGAPVPTGGIGPVSLAYSPDGTCLAVANQFSEPFPGTGSLSIFNVDSNTCEISPAGPPITDGVQNPRNPTSVSYSPDGKCIALANFNIISGTGTVSIYMKNSESCANVALVGSFATAGMNSTSVSFSPNGACLAVANSNLLTGGLGSVTVYSVDQATCELTPINTAVATGGSNPVNISYSADGQCLAVTNVLSNNMTIFSVDPATCAISSSALVATGSFPRSVMYSPNNHCVAVANSGFNPTGPIGPDTGSISIFENNILPRSILVEALLAKYCITCLEE